MKKRIAILLAGMLAAGMLLGGCGNTGTTPAGEATSDGKEPVSDGKEAVSDGEETVSDETKEEEQEAASDKGTMQVAESVQKAIEASDILTTGEYFRMADGSVVTRGESHDNFAGDYAALPDIRKIADSSSQTELLALSENGDLYFHQTKILSDVRDIVYSTTNVNQVAVCISGDKIYKIVVRNPADVNADLRAKSPDTYFDVGDKTINYFPVASLFSNLSEEEPVFVSGELARLGVEKGDFFVLNTDGQVFMDNNDGNSTEYVGMEFLNWENMAMIDAAKYMLSEQGASERELDLTVAGIQADGTVKACGQYADEILSWGDLNYITMDNGLIVGLLPDGTLKVTGPLADHVRDDLAGWTNLVGVKAGNLIGTAVVNAVDADGTYYHLQYDEKWSENVVVTVSAEAGCKDGTSWWYRYGSDGTVSRSGGGNGWEAQ